MKPEDPRPPGPNGVREPHYVQWRPQDAARAERKPRRGPRSTRVSIDELVEMGRTVVDRVRPYIERGVGRLRARFHRK